MKRYIVSVLASLVIALPAFAVIAPVPTDINQCKKGGWQNYDGTFKNQGDCVSYVVTDGRNEPDGPAMQ